MTPPAPRNRNKGKLAISTAWTRDNELPTSQAVVQAVQVLPGLVCTQLAGVRGNLVSLGDEAAHVDEEAVAGDAGSHEVVVQVTENVQLFGCNLQQEPANGSQSNLRR